MISATFAHLSRQCFLIHFDAYRAPSLSHAPRTLFNWSSVTIILYLRINYTALKCACLIRFYDVLICAPGKRETGKKKWNIKIIIMITLTLTPSPSSTFFRLAFNVHFCAVKIYFYFHFTLAKLFQFSRSRQLRDRTSSSTSRKS